MHTHIHANTSSHTNPHAHMLTHNHTHANTNPHTHTHSCVFTRVHMPSTRHRTPAALADPSLTGALIRAITHSFACLRLLWGCPGMERADRGPVTAWVPEPWGPLHVPGNKKCRPPIPSPKRGGWRLGEVGSRRGLTLFTQTAPTPKLPLLAVGTSWSRVHAWLATDCTTSVKGTWPTAAGRPLHGPHSSVNHRWHAGVPGEDTEGVSSSGSPTLGSLSVLRAALGEPVHPSCGRPDGGPRPTQACLPSLSRRGS